MQNSAEKLKITSNRWRITEQFLLVLSSAILYQEFHLKFCQQQYFFISSYPETLHSTNDEI